MPPRPSRGFFGTVSSSDGDVVAPVRPFAMTGLPVDDQRVRDPGESDGDPAIGSPPRPVRRAALDGLRLLEVTPAWAGPFVGNMLGALGVDVLKFEALPPFDGYRVLRLHTDSDSAQAAAMKGDNRWFEGGAPH